jgi:hypothetical protein
MAFRVLLGELSERPTHPALAELIARHPVATMRCSLRLIFASVAKTGRGFGRFGGNGRRRNRNLQHASARTTNVPQSAAVSTAADKAMPRHTNLVSPAHHVLLSNWVTDKTFATNAIPGHARMRNGLSLAAVAKNKWLDSNRH